MSADRTNKTFGSDTQNLPEDQLQGLESQFINRH